MSQPLLSIGMIVKNEERCLEKCLKALEPLRQAIPCELVIADTGSTDKTKEIASKYADILFNFTWVNDFSKARNAVIDKCSGKWFLTVDADEYLIPDIEEITTFLKSPLSDQKKLATIIQRNHHSETLDSSYADFTAVRMVRLNTGLRYSGEIHESFTAENTNDVQALTHTIFDHDGYCSLSPDFLKRKDERNLNLLEKKLEKEPNNLQIILQCLEATSYNEEKRIYYTNLAYNVLCNTSQDSIFWKSVAAPCIRQIIVFANEDNSQEIEKYVSWATQNFPDSKYTLIDVNYIYTKYLVKNKEYKKAIQIGNTYLKNIKTLNQSQRSSDLSDFISCLLYNTPIQEQMIRILLAIALKEENRNIEAIEHLNSISITPSTNNTILYLWTQTAILLKMDLPEDFYQLPAEKLRMISVNLLIEPQKIINSLIEYYMQDNKHTSFPCVSFIFNLLSEYILNGELSIELINVYVTVAEKYLRFCYKEEILNNQDYIQCIPKLHILAWYLVNAQNIKLTNHLDYIKTLRNILNKVPEANAIIEFLIEYFKNEEELKKQERIKNASPELVALAEQLKTMLSAFPENSPELLAIKQSPMYKQVAFLIEN